MNTSLRSCRRFLVGLTRAALVVAVLLGGAALGLAHEAELRIGKALDGVGAALMRLPEFGRNTPVRELSINGVELSVVTLSTELDIHAALGRLRGLCSRGGLDVPELLRSDANVPIAVFDGAFERAAEHEGAFGCLDTGEKLSLGELARRLDELRETGDLASLGSLRYALLRRTGKTTTVLVVAADGSVPLTTMFPGTGDAPGFDPPDLPRPAASRRLLSAAVHDAPYGLTLYESRASSPAALLEAQAAELGRRGWSSRRDARHLALTAERNGRAVVWHAGTLVSAGSYLSVVELARR